MRITDVQFTALAKLTRMSGGVRTQCARLILVDGLTPTESARQVGTTPQTATSAAAACWENFRLVCVAAGQIEPDKR